ncbi:MAG TPA: amidohydrolase family protein [Candidatus Acidoferrum sp.]|nr:amidohydrolase family protein [Candidatus Acidoferrum sp.]
MIVRAIRVRLILAVLPIAAVLFFTAFPAKPTHAQKTPSTTYYTHGRIYTNDPKQPWAEAMAVSEGKISCIGKMDHVLLDCGGGQEGVETVNLRGQFVMPGFNDAHVHLGGAGAEALAVPLIGVPSIEEMQKRVADAVAQHKPGEWITGGGWDHTAWPEKKFPNRQQLDAVAPKNPVILTHISGHVAVANSLALKSAEIDKSTPNPLGGEIEHDALGEPTGMLKEGAAMSLVRVRIPDPAPEQRRKGIELVLENVAKNGVTSVQDNSEWEDFQVYKQIKDEGKLTVRITEWLPFSLPLNDLQNLRAQGGTTDPWLKTGALKAVTDGALGSRTAAMLEPYSDDPSTTGIFTFDPDKLRAMAIERDKAGFQLNFHAIGDRANRIALDVFEAVRKANGPRDRRDRIEHAQVVEPMDFVRFAELKVIASMQPSHQTSDMRWAEDRIGPVRIKGAYAWDTMLKNGVRLAFGTDYSVEPISPFRGLYACVTRERPDGGPKSGWEPQEKISLEDCIRAYTSGSAYAQFEEGKKGELKPGEYADFIILSNDLSKVPPAQFTNTRVLRTVVGGRMVYSAN